MGEFNAKIMVIYFAAVFLFCALIILCHRLCSKDQPLPEAGRSSPPLLQVEDTADRHEETEQLCRKVSVSCSEKTYLVGVDNFSETCINGSVKRKEYENADCKVLPYHYPLLYENSMPSTSKTADMYDALYTKIASARSHLQSETSFGESQVK